MSDTSAQSKKAHGARFMRDVAPESWTDFPTIARECEQKGLTEFQAAAVLECMQGGSAETFADKRRCSRKTARAVVAKAAHRLMDMLDFNQRQSEYWREILACMVGHRGGYECRPLVGVLPHTNTGNQDTKELRKTLSDPRNYRTVSFRSPLISSHDLPPSGEAFLQELASFAEPAFK